MNLNEYESAFPPRAALPVGAEVMRVAPSPTGSPHIGTALQAMIDRAAATRSGGVFILRIEDTDRKRIFPGAIQEILDALSWLGVSPDEGPNVGGDYGPYIQSERLPVYRAAADWLVDHGHAYPCFCTPERLEDMRQQQIADGKPPMYDRRCRALPADEVAARLAAGEPSVIRLAVPPDTQIRFTDALRGEIVFDSNTVDDQVLLKSDGFPTYHLAVVVDDQLMHVTTELRGEEWISSTPKHILLYNAFGWPVPRIAHTALLRDAERRKLSKRSGDTSLAWFRTQGYLPEGLLNFMARILWTHPDGKDIYSFAEFSQLFTVTALHKSAPVANMDLLDFVNGQHIRLLGPDRLYDTTRDWLAYLLAQDTEETVFEVGAKGGERIAHAVPAAALRDFATSFTRDPAYSRRVLSLEPDRYKKLGDIVLQCPLFYADLFTPPDVAALVKPLGSAAAARTALDTYAAQWHASDTHDAWEQSVRAQADAAGVKPGKLFMTLRIALTASEQTPPLYDVLAVLGEAEARRRLTLARDALAQA